MMIGSVKVRMSPVRINGNKWHLSKQEYTWTNIPSILCWHKLCHAYYCGKIHSRGSLQGTGHSHHTPGGCVPGYICMKYLGYGLMHKEALNVERRRATSSAAVCSSSVAAIHSVSLKDFTYIWNTCANNW